MTTIYDVYDVYDAIVGVIIWVMLPVLLTISYRMIPYKKFSMISIFICILMFIFTLVLRHGIKNI